MILSTTALAFALIPLAFSHPLEKRQNALPPVNSTIDASVLQLALYLEHLELNLYTGGFVNFTDADYTAAGFPPGFRENVGVIADVSLPNLPAFPAPPLTIYPARESTRFNHLYYPQQCRLHPRPTLLL